MAGVVIIKSPIRFSWRSKIFTADKERRFPDRQGDLEIAIP
jgi:hypothetical protein